jgi:hypothetical protein
LTAVGQRHVRFIRVAVGVGLHPIDGGAGIGSEDGGLHLRGVVTGQHRLGDAVGAVGSAAATSTVAARATGLGAGDRERGVEFHGRLASVSHRDVSFVGVAIGVGLHPDDGGVGVCGGDCRLHLRGVVT